MDDAGWSRIQVGLIKCYLSPSSVRLRRPLPRFLDALTGIHQERMHSSRLAFSWLFHRPSGFHWKHSTPSSVLCARTPVWTFPLPTFSAGIGSFCLLWFNIAFACGVMILDVLLDARTSP